jgi:hypothetical protein
MRICAKGKACYIKIEDKISGKNFKLFDNSVGQLLEAGLEVNFLVH